MRVLVLVVIMTGFEVLRRDADGALVVLAARPTCSRMVRLER